MTEQYYTPKVEDLHVGYECYWIKDPSIAVSDSNLIPVKLNPRQLSGILFPPINWEREQTDKYIPNLGSYYTPYLTVEQIEKEGWLWRGNSGLAEFARSKPVLYSVKRINKIAYFLAYNLDLHTLEISKGKDVIFKGTCNSINELRTISKFLNI